MYPNIPQQVKFPELEKEILKFCDEHNVFERSIEQNKDEESYSFYDGPPFATGLPHYGHIMVGVLKDAVLRYQTMHGRYVPRRFGWDCHGLPVEYETEKLLGISGKRAIEEYGIDRFNEACRGIVQKFTEQWRSTVRRSGRWVSFENEYRTMDPDYMESIWWVMKQLWDKKLLYKGYYILPYCPRCSTVLSNHDVALGGYKDIHDPALTAKFRLVADARIPESQQQEVSFLAWTTTPWTLPSNMGLAVHAELNYSLVEDPENKASLLILASNKVAEFCGEDAQALRTFKGAELAGLSYIPLFDYYEDLRSDGAFRVHCGDFVSAEDGCGIVHCSSGFGEDDYKLMSAAGVPVVAPVDGECRFTEEVKEWEGVFVRDANKSIIQHLKDAGSVFKAEQILHAYPHCWRCESPLIYRAITSWFLKVEAIKDRIVAANQKIYWVPEHLKDGRFGNWLGNAKDWSISRNRYWGNPIPIWECANGHQVCVGSRRELQELSGGPLASDLHKHFIDQKKFKCRECGEIMERVPEVLDCWFESGAMPYAQIHYPFENKHWFHHNFPADFINESLDQTRGWFYTLTVLSVALFDEPPFKNCVVSGMILAEDGKKMSKSLRNYTPPEDIMESFGADAMRLYLLSSVVVKGEPIRFSDNDVRETLKSIILPLWNAYSFYVTYANADKVFPSGPPENPQNPLDQWILSELETLVEKFSQAMDKLLLPQAVSPLLNFIDLLNNWYIRRSRRRFWKGEQDADKQDAYATLYYVLMQVVRVAAPLIPFVTEKIYQGLQVQTEGSAEAGQADSVHLGRFPQSVAENRNAELEEKMLLARRCVSLARALRAQYKIRNRMPLAQARIVTRNPAEKAYLIELIELIKEELNVKEVLIDEDEATLVSYKAKANFRVLGKILGKDMKTAAAELEKLDSQSIGQILDGGEFELQFAGANFQSYKITAELLEVQRLEREGFHVLNEGSLTLALQTEISDELYQEGLVRDMIRIVQNLRKEADLEISQRISLRVNGSSKLEEALGKFGSELKQETQADEWHWDGSLTDASSFDLGSGEERLQIVMDVVS